MHINIETDSGVTFLKVTGDIDIPGTEYFEKTVGTILHDANLRLVFDFSDCMHVTSKAIGMLMWAKAEARGAGGDILLLNPHAKLSSLLKLIGLGDVLSTISSHEEAIKLLGE